MGLAVLLAALLTSQVQVFSSDAPIHVGNAQANPLDLSVTYEFVNEVTDVTAYEVSITRYFADGSTLVSTQGQDWFSYMGYTMSRSGAYSMFAVWLPPYPSTKPDTHLHLLSSRPQTNAALIDADVTLTAVIRLDGSATGNRRVLERLFSQRAAMLAEYAYWLPRFQRAGAMEDPQAAWARAVEALSKPRRGETLPGPRECLFHASSETQRWAADHPNDAARELEALIKTMTQQYQLLLEQSVWKR